MSVNQYNKNMLLEINSIQLKLNYGEGDERMVNFFLTKLLNLISAVRILHLLKDNFIWKYT